jgi:hypothetical protein
MSKELEKRFEKYIVKHVRNSTRTFKFGTLFEKPKRRKQFRLSKFVGERIALKLFRFKKQEAEKHKIIVKTASQRIVYCSNRNCLNDIASLRTESERS